MTWKKRIQGNKSEVEVEVKLTGWKRCGSVLATAAKYTSLITLSVGILLHGAALLKSQFQIIPRISNVEVRIAAIEKFALQIDPTVLDKRYVPRAELNERRDGFYKQLQTMQEESRRLETHVEHLDTALMNFIAAQQRH